MNNPAYSQIRMKTAERFFILVFCLAPAVSYAIDSDSDGLDDLVETNTGVFLSPNDTGTDPLVDDTDSDGFIDGLEVLLGTNPVNGLESPSEQKLTASDAEAYDEFGYRVAISGDTAVVGAYMEDSSGLNAGSVYVYTRTGFTWSEQQKLFASDGAIGDRFGISVSVSGDTIAIGAEDEDEGGPDAGAVYIFTRSGSLWSEQQKLIASDSGNSDMFGRSVSLEADTLVVGASNGGPAGINSGAAYVFTRTAGVWSEQQKLVPSDGQSSDRFGQSVSLSASTLVVGADREDTVDGDSGAAYVFEWNGANWQEQQILYASDAQFLDYFGYSVAVSGDSVVVGAYREGTNGSFAGAAYVFTRSGSNWTEQQKLLPDDGGASDNKFFGYSVSIEGDLCVIGTRERSAYVFERNIASWSQERKIVSSDPLATRFGSSVAMSSASVIVGGNLTDGAATDEGAAYAFNLAQPGAGTDSDGDGLLDEFEVIYGFDPINTDESLQDGDGDGLNNLLEQAEGTNPLISDSDADGLSDGDEVNTYLTNPLVADTDMDGLTDGQEVTIYFTNPLLADTDMDNVNDGDEVANGTDPLDPLDPLSPEPVAMTIPLMAPAGLIGLMTALGAVNWLARRRRK